MKCPCGGAVPGDFCPECGYCSEPRPTAVAVFWVIAEVLGWALTLQLVLLVAWLVMVAS